MAMSGKPIMSSSTRPNLTLAQCSLEDTASPLGSSMQLATPESAPTTSSRKACPGAPRKSTSGPLPGALPCFAPRMLFLDGLVTPSSEPKSQPSPPSSTPATPFSRTNLRTPMNAASSSWRTHVCPSAPLRQSGPPKCSSSSSSPIMTPANCWSSPTGAPMSVGSICGRTLFRRPATDENGDTVFIMPATGLASPLMTPTATPLNSASTSWRNAVCPKPPHRRMVMSSSTSACSTPSGLLTPANSWPCVSTTSTPMSCINLPSARASRGARLMFHREVEDEETEEIEQDHTGQVEQVPEDLELEELAVVCPNAEPEEELEKAVGNTMRCPKESTTAQQPNDDVHDSPCRSPDLSGCTLASSPPPRPKSNVHILGTSPMLAPTPQRHSAAAASIFAGTPEPSRLVSLAAMHTPSPVALPPRRFRKAQLLPLAPSMPGDSKKRFVGGA
mmetsp:Transcript_120343/g.384196  ORF Transcript_120343/g.384196 Transcript_120343/m.384196 type:complete len:446 (+) Transcript_120343:73-1410(+)